MCEDLAIHHKIDHKKAAQAGLMHDLAKFFPPPKLLDMAKKEYNEIDSICLSNPIYTRECNGRDVLESIVQSNS